jgi:hypothetical protein
LLKRFISEKLLLLLPAQEEVFINLKKFSTRKGEKFLISFASRFAGKFQDMFKFESFRISTEKF